MKITLVTETFPPEINGVAMTLGRLVDGLAKLDQCVTVVAPHRPDRIASKDDAFEFVSMPGCSIPRYPELKFGLPANAKFARLWKDNRPDIIHVATEGPLGWSAISAARKAEIPVVSSFHTNFHSYGQHYGYGFLQNMIFRWLRYCHNRCLRTFVPSEDIRTTLLEKGFENVSILSRGVDSTLFGPHQRDPELRQSWGASPSDPVAIYVGRLASEKNLDLVIKAYDRMRTTLPSLRLVLVGDGPARQYLESARRDIHFAGMQEGVNLAAHYASADCFLFGSTTETFGNVVTEAMASGIPVLAYDYAAPAKFIEHQRNGFLAPFGDSTAFLDAALDLARFHHKWNEMGSSARAVMLPHSWSSIVHGYLQELLTISSIHGNRSF
jgi:glycosyltransferase involved in cell wall biosynthesis